MILAANWLDNLVDDIEAGVVSAELAGVLALVTLVVVLAVMHWVLITKQGPLPAADTDAGRLARRRRGVKSLVMGADGRASTSKLQAVLWTAAVLYVFVFMLVWGRSTDCPATSTSRPCIEAVRGRAAFDSFIRTDLQAEYYVLLGFPIAAALAAKALTSGKIANGTLTSEAPPEGKGVVQGVSEVVGNDHGEADLLDAQYFAFTLLTLAFFAFEFFTTPANGLPNLPPTLVALSGFSVAAYTTKKALQTDVLAVITDAIPGEVPLTEGQEIVLIGNGFGSIGPLSQAVLGGPGTVTLGPRSVIASSWTPTRVTFRLSSADVAALQGRQQADITLVDSDGVRSESKSVVLSASS